MEIAKNRSLTKVGLRWPRNEMCVFNNQCKSASRAKATTSNLNKARGTWITTGFMSVVRWNWLTPKSCRDRDVELPTNPGGAGVKGMCQPLCSSVQFSHSVTSDSLRPHGLQHIRLFCPSPTPRVYSNSCPLSRWCHPTISSFVVPFFSCLQSFWASGSFQISQFFASGGQRTGASASASVLPVDIQGWFPLGWTGWISLQSKGLSRVFSSTTVQKYQFFCAQLSLWSNSHIQTWLLGKP